jgi:outer membrane receptor protein involved in Fe transport
MSPQTTPRLHVDVGGTAELEFKLVVAGVRESVTVSGEPPFVETQPSGVSSLIDERAVSELPLNGRRFTDLALLTPGGSQDPRGLTSGSNGELAFGGIRVFQSSYLVDGGDNNNAFFGQARPLPGALSISNEVVQEFMFPRNTYGAELGRAGGAVVNVVTKSGSNRLHGTDFYYMRDSALAAKHPFMDFKRTISSSNSASLWEDRYAATAHFFAGFDQLLPHSGGDALADRSSVVVPKPEAGGATKGRAEATDQALVFATAAHLSKQAGTYPASMLGNAGFFKLDLVLTEHNNLSMRLNTSRYYGHNNVFLDPASPLTSFGISDNGEEDVSTESAALTLTSNLSFRVVSRLRAQFSRDLQQSTPNSTDPLTKIPTIIEGFGRSSILPRQTREHRLHVAETFSVEGKRHSWKFGGDVLLTWIYNFFPSLSGGEYIFDPIKVNPFTFEPMEAGRSSRACEPAHQVPHYYLQSFGSAVTHPDTNEYAGFVQDTIRVTDRFALSLGTRYDLQTFTTKGLQSNPLWPNAGKVPFNTNNFAPRVGLAYSIGDQRPLVIRAGYGLFYTRIPQIYTSTIQSDNGLVPNFLFLNNNDFYAHQIFPQYPNPLVSCPVNATECQAPPALTQLEQADVSAFSHNFKTPHVQQAGLNVEREVAHRLAVGISYMYVHGVDLIRPAT